MTTALPPREPPEPVRRPVMWHQWERVLFIHWPVDPGQLRALLPAGLEPDLMAGSAYVGLIPFLLTVRPFRRGPAVLRATPEINLRTYVRGPDGGQGIHFLSLELGRLWAARFARYSYRLPYHWAATSFEQEAARIVYGSRRRPWGAPHCQLVAEIGEPIADGEESDLQRFLSARWRLYSRIGRLLLRARVEHPPWKLHRARLLHLEQNLVVAAGLPPPDGSPSVVYSPGTTARFGPPQPAQPGPASASLSLRADREG